MQAQSAQGFNRLPKELRDMIWDAAIRDDRPAAHFLSVDCLENRMQCSDECVVFGFSDGPSLEERRYFGRWLSVTTQQALRQRFGQPAINPSAYLEDGGLWTACKESHEAVRRRRKRQAGGIAMAWPTTLWRWPRTDIRPATMTGYFDNNGTRQYFAIGVDDLICWQPVDFNHCFELRDVPFYNFKLGKPFALRNVAFEFDPDWEHPEDVHEYEYFWYQESSLGAIADILCKPEIHLWFIDYGIQRDAASTAVVNDARDERKIFYGNGCRFVEVRGSDGGWVYPRLDSGEPARGTALYFARQLDEGMKDYERVRNYERIMDRSQAADALTEEIEERDGAALGVLACEYSWSD